MNRNRLHNVSNPYQGNTKKVLCVCSAGLLRSPTLAALLSKDLGYNTRAVGISTEYALVPLEEVHLVWADEVVFVDEENYNEAKKKFSLVEIEEKMVVLDIPDNFAYNDPLLVNLIRSKYPGYNYIEE